MLEHRRFHFFPCLREQPGKQSSARSPSSKYRLTYVGKNNKLFLVLFRIFLTAFPFEKDGCQHSSSSPFLAGNHEYTFEDWRERTKKITGLAKTRSLSRKSPVFFFRISFSYNVFVLFPFQFEIKQCAILLPWKLFLSNESRSFCTRLFLLRFINRNRNTAQKEYALGHLIRTENDATTKNHHKPNLEILLRKSLFFWRRKNKMREERQWSVEEERNTA